MAKTRTVYFIEAKQPGGHYIDGRQAPPYWNRPSGGGHYKPEWPEYFASKREAGEIADLLREEHPDYYLATRIGSERWDASLTVSSRANQTLAHLSFVAGEHAADDKSAAKMLAEFERDPVLRREFVERAIPLLERALERLRQEAADD